LIRDVHIEIDLTTTPARAELVDPEDCKAFKVVIRGGDLDQAQQAIRRIGTLKSREEAWIDVSALEEMAEGRVPSSWPDDFAAMLAYARAKGWLDEQGQQVQAHCEWTATG
jgi:hypothetical protein